MASVSWGGGAPLSRPLLSGSGARYPRREVGAVADSPLDRAGAPHCRDHRGAIELISLECLRPVKSRLDRRRCVACFARARSARAFSLISSARMLPDCFAPTRTCLRQVGAYRSPL